MEEEKARVKIKKKKIEINKQTLWFIFRPINWSIDRFFVNKKKGAKSQIIP